MTIAFTGGRVFIGKGTFLDNATVIVEKNRIIKVSEKEIPLPKEAKIFSLKGCTLLPGFIDCHVHFCLDGSPDPVSPLLNEHPSITTIKTIKSAHRTLMTGVTTVRDLGGKDGIDIAVRDSIKSGLIPGPRMLVSGRMICMTGGHGWQVGREADGLDEVMKAVREQVRAGVDIVKFMATGGIMTEGVEPGSEQFTEEELRAGISEAHKAGRRTATHAQGTKGILNALLAGIDSIEHGIFLDHETIGLMKENNIPFIPTISACYNIEDKGVEAGIPAYVVEKTIKTKSAHKSSIHMAHEAGVLIAMGTDAGTPFNLHGSNLEELIRLTEMGFSTIEALDAGTSIASKVLGLEKDLGTIEEGKLADLVVVDGNPLDDLGILLNRSAIKIVMQEGKLVKDELE